MAQLSCRWKKGSRVSAGLRERDVAAASMGSGASAAHRLQLALLRHERTSRQALGGGAVQQQQAQQQAAAAAVAEQQQQQLQATHALAAATKETNNIKCWNATTRETAKNSVRTCKKKLQRPLKLSLTHGVTPLHRLIFEPISLVVWAFFFVVVFSHFLVQFVVRQAPCVFLSSFSLASHACMHACMHHNVTCDTFVVSDDVNIVTCHL